VPVSLERCQLQPEGGARNAQLGYELVERRRPTPKCRHHSAPCVVAVGSHAQMRERGDLRAAVFDVIISKEKTVLFVVSAT
jgi:hypothetical protein